METRANYVLVGVFTLAAIAGAFLFVLWLAGAAKTPEHKTYQVIFTGSVSGLTRGSSVLFNGLNVGSVSSIDFLENDPSRVSATIEVAGRAPIKTDTKARLESQGLTGVAAIALTGGAEAASALVGENGKPPVIHAEPSQLQNLLETVQRLSGKADDVIDKANRLLGDNSATITDTLANLDSFSKALAGNSAGVNSALKAVADLGQKIGPLAARLETLSGDVDTLVKAVDAEKVRGVVKNVEAFSATLADSRGHVDSLLSDAASVAKKLNETVDQMGAALGDLRGLAKAVDPDRIASVIAHVDGLVSAVEADKVKTFVGNVAEFSSTLARNQHNVDSLLADAASLAQNLSRSSGKLDGILGDLGNLAKAVDDKKIAGAVDNVSRFAQSLGDNQGNVDRMLKNASELSAKLNNSADKLDELMASVQAFVGSPETKGALTQVGDAAHSVRQFADDLNQRTKEIAVGLTRFTGSGLREYEALAVNARRTLDDLDHAIRAFERNPNQLIFGAKPALPEYHGGQQ